MSAGLKFFHAWGSPPSRSCYMLLKALDLDVDVKLVNLAAGEQNSEEFLKLNPLHQVPVMVDDQFVLTESRAILGYLVNKFKPDSPLYPSDPQKRAIIDQRLYYDATVVFESCSQIIRLVLHNGVKKIPQESREKLVNTLKFLDGILTKSKWVAGNETTIADYSILGTITTVKELGYDLPKHTKLNDWYMKCHDFPGFEENVKGAKYLADRMFALMDDKF